jgi:hypothetical protein
MRVTWWVIDIHSVTMLLWTYYLSDVVGHIHFLLIDFAAQ